MSTSHTKIRSVLNQQTLVRQFCCIACYGGLIFTANIQYQRYEDLKPTELMVSFLHPGPFTEN